jgi:hypothetical protein
MDKAGTFCSCAFSSAKIGTALSIWLARTAAFSIIGIGTASTFSSARVSTGYSTSI